MVWDPGEPTNGTKIRNAPGLLQANWDAIETADSSFQPDAIILTNRDALAVPNDAPAAVSGGTSRGDGYTLYCKEDPSGSPQLYGIDKDSVISQFTSSVKSLASSGYALLAPGILMQWGTDTFTNPSGSSTEQITFAQPYSATPWVVNITLKGNNVSGSTPKPFGVTNITTTTFDATQLNGVTAVAPFSFNWISIGPDPV